MPYPCRLLLLFPPSMRPGQGYPGTRCRRWKHGPKIYAFNEAGARIPRNTLRAASITPMGSYPSMRPGQGYPGTQPAVALAVVAAVPSMRPGQGYPGTLPLRGILYFLLHMVGLRELTTVGIVDQVDFLISYFDAHITSCQLKEIS